MLNNVAPMVSHGIPIIPWYDCEVYLRVEQLQQDFEAFAASKFGIRNAVLPTMNKRRNIANLSNISKSLIRQISHQYRFDMIRFNYSLNSIPC